MHLRTTRYIWTSTFVVALTLMQFEESRASNILAIFPVASRSHNNVYSTVTKELVRKGHTLTVVTSHPMDSPPPNYKQIDISKEMKDRLNPLSKTETVGLMRIVLMLKDVTLDVCTDTYKNPKVRELMNPSKTGNRFDLILTSTAFPECIYGFAHVHKAPIVLLSPSGAMPNINNAIGNIILPSVVANPGLGLNDRMTFLERVVNTLTIVGLLSFHYLYLVRNMEYEMRQGFGESLPSVSDLEKHISLVVANSHFSLNGPHPLVPSLIEAGGLHVKRPTELPQGLKSFLDGAGNDGVIYFSLGSILKSENFPVETRDAFVAAFAQLKQKVLWKWEGTTPIPGQSENVRLDKWFPQQDLLAHPNIKLFITHGGLLSFQEASWRGVPLIGIPYFGDQDMNMNKVTELELGLKLDPKNLTTENILKAINQILGDSKYATNMKKIKSIVNDQAEHPLDRAIYWIEYVIRHNGAEHLKSASRELKWYQAYMFDVLFVLVVIPFIVFSVVTYFIIKLIRKKCFAKKKSKDTSKKEQ